MMQFFADHIDQMDLALDQLALRDRNFSRFALMLIDNVVELTLHQYAQDRTYENDIRSRYDESCQDQKIIIAALGQHFDSKIKLAKYTGLISNELSESIKYLHTFRNTAYHRGLRHETVLNSISLFYFKCACLVLERYSPLIWSSGSKDQIPYRAKKYLGNTNGWSMKEDFQVAWVRLHDVAESMGDNLVTDLHQDMEETINRIDKKIQFLVDETPGTKKTRTQIIRDNQAWAFAFSDEGKKYATANREPNSSTQEYIEWLSSTYQWATKTDPIPSWKKRLRLLNSEKNPHLALGKYCEFMNQTESLRVLIDDWEAQLDGYIQQQIDISRGK